MDQRPLSSANGNRAHPCHSPEIHHPSLHTPSYLASMVRLLAHSWQVCETPTPHECPRAVMPYMNLSIRSAFSDCHILRKMALPLLVVAAAVSPLSAANFSLVGSFSQDSDVQLIRLSVTAVSSVSIRTLSYAGGTNASGLVIPEGGFDPYLALFDSSGALITDNDDDESATKSVVTGWGLDASIEQVLLPGSYTAAVSEFDNSATGPNLSAGFKQEQNGNFTRAFGCSSGAFCEFDGFDRTSEWAVDFLNVASISTTPLPISETPEPASVCCVGAALGAGFMWRRCHFSKRASKGLL